jgi:heat shock protein HslJ
MVTRIAGLVLFALVVVAGCGDDDEDSPGGAPDVLTGRTFLSQSVTMDGAPHPLVDGTVIRLEVAADQIRVHAGCNHLFGTLESTAGGRLRVTQMGGTEMGCDPALHDQDQWLADLLTAHPSWSLDRDTLTLSGDTTVITLLDRRVADPDRPLEGTRWIVDTLLSGDAASSLPTDAVAELTFSSGQLTGSTGCNDLSGSYRLDVGVIHLDAFVQTDVMCEPDVMILEEAVVALSGASVEYEIVAGRLTLTGPDGRGLGLQAVD